MVESPVWYKLNLRKLSWGEFKRHVSGDFMGILIFTLLKLGIAKPSVNAVYRLPEEFDRQRCEESDISVDAQLAVKPSVGALVYESGFRVAVWQKTQGEVLDPNLIGNAAALLLHESGLYRAAILYGRNQMEEHKPDAEGKIAVTHTVKEILQTYVFTQMQSGRRVTVTDAALYLDVPKSAHIHSDTNLKPAQMLPKLQELIAGDIARGDKPVVVNTVEELRDAYDTTRREELAFRVARGTYTPATEEEVAHFRALIYDRESQQR